MEIELPLFACIVIGDLLDSLPKLPGMFRERQVRLLSFTESMLGEAEHLIDNFSETMQEYRNSTGETRTNIKRGLKFFKQKARRYREDLEDEIEAEKEKLEELQKEDDTDSQKAIEETSSRIEKLKEIRKKLKSVIRGKPLKKEETEAKLDKPAVTDDKEKERVKRSPLDRNEREREGERRRGHKNRQQGHKNDQKRRRNENRKPSRLEEEEEEEDRQLKQEKVKPKNVSKDKLREDNQPKQEDDGIAKPKFGLELNKTKMGLGDGFGRHDTR